MVGPTLLMIAFIAALTVGIVATVRAVPQGAWGNVMLGVLGIGLALSGLISAPPSTSVAVKPREQGPVAGCAHAGFPVCAPFQTAWEPLEEFYGPAISSAIYLDGRLTQCFARACLQSFPELPGYQVQGMLLGERYLVVHLHQTPDSIRDMVLPPLPARWLRDKARSADLLQLLGQPIKGQPTDAAIGRWIAVWQRRYQLAGRQ